MDIAETMKNVLAKQQQQQVTLSDLNGQQGVVGLPSAMGGYSGVAAAAAAGYVTEKLYMLLQLYLQNKGWNPSMELLQCFTELKEASMLPSAAYLQLMASRVTLDSQGRLVKRDNGKIILPFEHFANAVMLKHMNGPHGLHLSLDATVRAVMDSYTIGRENFGMEKDFIVEVVQNCPSPACRYYKTQMDFTQKQLQQHLALAAAANSPYLGGGVTTTTPNVTPPPPPHQHTNSKTHFMGGIETENKSNLDLPLPPQKLQMLQPPQNMHQQSRSNLIHTQAMEKSLHRHQPPPLPPQTQPQQHLEQLSSSKNKLLSTSSSSGHHYSSTNGSMGAAPPPPPSYIDYKLTDFIRANLDSLEGFSTANKDLLTMHNGGGGISPALAPPPLPPASTLPPPPSQQAAQQPTTMLHLSDSSKTDAIGQEKIIKGFGEIMKNMQRMKTYVRPSMCKPYGKQSEALQKSVIDTIQLIQQLRSFLPPPHIQVNSWKNDDKHRYEEPQ